MPSERQQSCRDGHVRIEARPSPYIFLVARECLSFCVGVCICCGGTEGVVDLLARGGVHASGVFRFVGVVLLLSVVPVELWSWLLCCLLPFLFPLLPAVALLPVYWSGVFTLALFPSALRRRHRSLVDAVIVVITFAARP